MMSAAVDFARLPACPSCEARLKYLDRHGCLRCAQCSQPAAREMVAFWLRPVGPRGLSVDTFLPGGGSRGFRLDCGLVQDSIQDRESCSSRVLQRFVVYHRGVALA